MKIQATWGWPMPCGDEPCEVAILGGFDKGARSFTAYCDCGRQHTLFQVRSWQKAAARKNLGEQA